MGWTIEYYEQEDTTQPAEVFEEMMDQDHPELAGKLIRIADQLVLDGPRVSGGMIKSCRGYKGLWEIRAIYGQWLARELFGFDGQQVILLHGYVKRGGDEASTPDLDKAEKYWKEYQRTRRISPVREDIPHEPI